MPLFSEEEVISFIIPGSQPLGIGKYGEVFKGFIPAVSNHHLDEQQNEIQWLSDVNHDNIINYVGHCQTEQKIYIVCEFANGGDLLNSLQGLRWEETLTILKGIAAGISHMHSMNVRIGDMKTANVLLTEQKQPKLADFGTVKSMAAQNQNPNPALPADEEEEDSGIIGTFGFIDPRRLWRDDDDLSDDIYGFGMIMLQLLTKREIGLGDNHLSKIARKEFEEGKIIVHDRLRATGCSKMDAIAITQLALDLTDYRPVNAMQDPAQLLRMRIEDVIPALNDVKVVRRSFFKQTELKISLIAEKIKWKISKK